MRLLKEKIIGGVFLRSSRDIWLRNLWDRIRMSPLSFGPEPQHLHTGIILHESFDIQYFKKWKTEEEIAQQQGLLKVAQGHSKGGNLVCAMALS